MLAVSAFDLWEYDDVVKHEEEILEQLGGGMPPVANGGLWPDELVELFRRWTTSGHKRLELGTAEYTVNVSSTNVTLTATGTFPAAGYRGWLQLESETDTARTYVLYFEAPDGPGTGSTAFTRRDKYSADGKSLSVHDSTGVHLIPGVP